MNQQQLEEELKKIGVAVVSGRQDTVVTVQIKGLAGRPLERALRLADQLLLERVKRVLQANTDPTTKLFHDPTFGPCADDPGGAAAICKSGLSVPSKGASQHQAKVLALLKSDKIRWERPQYAQPEVEGTGDNPDAVGDDDYDDDSRSTAFARDGDEAFATQAVLFSDGVCSGDVIQGNLGDCWFLSALSVVATRSDLLEQTFWRADAFKSKGLYVCKFMKNFVWNYVMIDDRLPVFGYSKTKAGKPYFARCRDPNELWVSMLEKAYAKLHGSYESLIGGFVDVALNDLTGMCSEQVIMKTGYPGFGEDPFAPILPGQQLGDPFWLKILRYKTSGTLMGCSIQPVPAGDKNVAAESSAGNGLYYKHAYALVDAAEVKTVRNEQVKLVKLRNPWGMGEWTGPWSDSSPERAENEDIIKTYFKILKRTVGGNAQKRVFLLLNGRGEVAFDEIAQEEVIEANINDGTFFMSYVTWMQYFTHFFAGIDFPDVWSGRRVEGRWDESTCGGNISKSTWTNNPQYALTIKERSRVFISLSQEDPRGKDTQKIVPVGFHVCSLCDVSGGDTGGKKFEMKEPAKKADAYYRLYKAPKDRADFQSGARPEPLPPLIIPGSAIPGIDGDGVPQPAYTFKQAVSAEATLEPGRYCIVPSMYMRTDKDTGKTNVGSFWISVYADKASFQLEGGEQIVEEEEGGDTEGGSDTKYSRTGTGLSLGSPSKSSDAGVVVSESLSVMDKRKKYEDAKDELLRQAKLKGIGIRELKVEFAKATTMKRADCRRKLQSLGFKVDDLNDDKVNALLNGLDDSNSGSIKADRLVGLFETEISEDQMACDIPEVENDEPPEKLHQEGVLQIHLHGATDLSFDQKRRTSAGRKIMFPPAAFDVSQLAIRRKIAAEILEGNSALATRLRHLSSASAVVNGCIPSLSREQERGSRVMSSSSSYLPSTPVQEFYEQLEKKFDERRDTPSTDSIDTPTVSGSAFACQKASPVRVQTSRSSEVPVGYAEELLHSSKQMQELEKKRVAKLAHLQNLKHKSLGDVQLTLALPRLIGGRKSGSSYTQCIDCGFRVPIPRRREADTLSNTFACTGSNCVNVFCSECYSALPRKVKLCDDCFANEHMPIEIVGERLRGVLIDKIGTGETQRAHLDELFKSFDVDQSGKLSADEFSRALSQLRIQPSLTREQTLFLLDQFDTNNDGEVSLAEFSSWILHDQLWKVEEQQRDRGSNGVDDVLNNVIIPIRESIIDASFAALAMRQSIKQWSWTTNSPANKPTTVSSGESERGALVFQRVLAVRGLTDISSVVQQLFARFDLDNTGDIDSDEFSLLLASLGVQTESSDAKIILDRACSSLAMPGRALTRRSLMAFIGSATSRPPNLNCPEQQQHFLPRVLLRLRKLTDANSAIKQPLAVLLRQLHANMSSSEAASLSRCLLNRYFILVNSSEVLRLANALCSDDEFVARDDSSSVSNEQGAGLKPKRTVLKRSCNIVMDELLASSSSLATLVNTFDILSVCHQMSSFITTTFAGATADEAWKQLIGTAASDVISQRTFLERFVDAGLSLRKSSEAMQADQLSSCVVTKLQVALALDAVRVELTQDISTTDETRKDVTLDLWSFLLRYRQIAETERKFYLALSNLLRFSRGEQHFLISMAIDDVRRLIVRVTDPIYKTVADLALSSDDYDFCHVLSHMPGLLTSIRRVSEGTRDKVFMKEPHALVTATLMPILNAAIVHLVGRLRVSTMPLIAGDSGTTATPLVPYISLVESDGFLSTLRGLFTGISAPFFWSVGAESLDFSIDVECLKRGLSTSTNSFMQLVGGFLSSRHAPAPIRALCALLLNCSSSVSVCFEVIGEQNRVAITWDEFQASLAGSQDMYAVMELRPQGDTSSTDISSAGSVGAVDWDFERSMLIREPATCDLRIDRPVVYTDTVKVATITPDLGEGSARRIAFVEDKDSGPAHFVIVTVRKASTTDTHGKPPRLYCTAYDPLTSCDYAVSGYPNDWTVDFFNSTANPDYEAKWRGLLLKMSLGVALTPKLAVKVFSRQLKADQLVGECEVTVASAIAREGHVFHEMVALQHPTRPQTTTGRIQITFSFDAKKASEVVAVEAAAQVRRESSVLQGPIKLDANLIEKEPVVAPDRLDDIAAVKQEYESKLNELRGALRRSEQVQEDAQEQVKTLRRQLQQSSNATNAAANEEASRWQRTFEQAMRDQAALQQDKDRRLSQLQDELKRQADEMELRAAEISKPPPAPASNLRQAALGADASAHDILSAMKEILLSRCPERPYNGLKKSLAAVAEVPGKVAISAFEDVLGDFGLAVTPAHRGALYSILDAESRGLISIEDFFIKLCGDADAYSTIIQLRQRASPLPIEEPTPSPEIEEIASPPLSAPSAPPGPPSPPAPGPMRPKAMNWREMKKFLILNLPEGWETRFTEKGRPYFCNHANRSTQWKHPRPDIETMYSEWMQENGANFSRTSSSNASSRR